MPADRPVEGGPRFALPPAAVLGLGAIVFLAFAAEGARHRLERALSFDGEEARAIGMAASGVAIFSVAMVFCRLTGDWMVADLGRQSSLRAAASLIAAGMILAVAAPWPLVAALGFGIVGIGAANVVPVAISAAHRARPAWRRASASPP